MNNEIKERIKYFKHYVVDNLSLDAQDDFQKILDCITNLQEENDRLKEKLNCKEYFSSTMPENTEFVILTKENYDRQQKDIELELIDYKLRNEKAIEYIKENIADIEFMEENYDLDFLNKNEIEVEYKDIKKLIELLEEVE